MKKIDDLGMGIVEVMLIVLLVSGIAFAGYYVRGSNRPEQKTAKITDSDNSAGGDPTIVKTDKDTTPKTDKENTKLLEGSMDNGLGVEVSFKYSETWAIDKSKFTEDRGNVGQSVTLTSPTNSLTVTYEVNNYGLGGYCAPEENGLITSLKIEDVVGYDKVKYVEYSSETGDYFSGFALLSKDKVASSGVGKSICEPYLANVVDLGKLNGVHLVARINPKNNTAAGLDYETYNAVLNDSSYAEAKAILMSTVLRQLTLKKLTKPLSTAHATDTMVL